MKFTALASALVSLVIFSGSANASVVNVSAGSLGSCPTVGVATSCAAVYRFNLDGSVDTLVDPTIPSTDGIEDTLIGVLNISGHTINSLTLDGGSINIFGFDGEGGSTVLNPGSGPGDTYFGNYFASNGSLIGITTFSGINALGNQGTINFAGLTNGGHGWFVLEEQINFSAPPTPSAVPLPGAVWLFGTALAGFAGFGRKKSI